MLETLMRKLKPDRLVLTHLYTSRALSMEAMEKAAHRVADGCEVQSIPDVKTAYQTLVQEKRPEDTCFCVGSLYLIGELEKKISRTGFDSTARNGVRLAGMYIHVIKEETLEEKHEWRRKDNQFRRRNRTF